MCGEDFFFFGLWGDQPFFDRFNWERDLIDQSDPTGGFDP
jgi:hypothetical protein